jgi:hypothetical protein
MANSYMKYCSKYLAIRKMNIKTTLRLNQAIIRMDIIKKKVSKCRWGWSLKGRIKPFWWGCKSFQLLWKLCRGSSKACKELSYDPAILFLGIYPKEQKLAYYMNSHVYFSTVHNQITYSEKSQSHKENYHISLTCGHYGRKRTWKWMVC